MNNGEKKKLEEENLGPAGRRIGGSFFIYLYLENLKQITN
jgi:hypothetical protein